MTAKNTMAVSTYFAKLGAPMRNVRNSWCAYSAERRRAIFTVWSQLLIDGRYLLRSAGVTSEDHLRGAIEMRRILDTVVAGGDEVLGVLCHVNDPSEKPWVRKSFEEDRVLVLRLAVEPEGILAYVQGEASAEDALLGPVGPLALRPYGTSHG